MAVLGRPEALQSKPGQPLARVSTVREGVAIIPVCGPLSRASSPIQEILSLLGGGSSYETIRKDLQAAIEDPRVHSILLEIDSPGGDVNGAGELAQAIYEAGKSKEVRCYVQGTCASAALWIASGAKEIVCSPTAEIGSIGVCQLWIDDSKMLANAGIKEHLIVSAQSPLKSFDPSSEDDRARVQAKLNQLADIFISDVAKYRAMSPASILAGGGATFIGQHAVAAGFADRLGDFESLLSEMAAEAAKGKTTMSAKEDGATFAREVLAMLGVEDHAKAMGALVALKNQAEEAVKVQAQLTALLKEKQAAEIKAAIDGAILGGYPAAKRAMLESLGEKYGLEGVQAAAEASKRPEPAVPASPHTLQQHAQASGVAQTQFTRDQIKIAQMAGIKPEEIAAHKLKSGIQEEA